MRNSQPSEWVWQLLPRPEELILAKKTAGRMVSLPGAAYLDFTMPNTMPTTLHRGHSTDCYKNIAKNSQPPPMGNCVEGEVDKAAKHQLLIGLALRNARPAGLVLLLFLLTAREGCPSTDSTVLPAQQNQCPWRLRPRRRR